MNLKRFTLFTMAIAITFISQAQTADEILANYFENTGGIDKWKAMKNMKAIGNTPTPNGDVNFTMFAKAPNKLKVEVDLGGSKMVPQAYDGETAWMLNPMAGNQAQKLPEDQAKMIAEDASFEDDFINYKEKGHEVALEGTEEIDGVETFKIKLTKNANNDKMEKVEYHFFDKENYVPIMTRMTVTEGQAAGTTIETYLSDYQETDYGLIMPYYIEQKFNGQTGQKLTINEYLINSEIDDSMFQFPG